MRRPPMVRLEDFGKPPAPPPPAPFDVRSHVSFAVVAGLVLLMGSIGWDWATERASTYWTRTAEIADQGRFGTR